MKAMKFFRVMLALVGILLSACSTQSNSGAGKAVPEVVFTGVIESMNGDQWMVDGQTISVDSSILRDGPFGVGDTIKVEASVAPDGSITVQRVESPLDGNPGEMNQGHGNAQDPAPTPAPGTGPQPLVFDDDGKEASGTVDSITDTSITVGGQTFNFADGVEIKGDITAGSVVKLHFTLNADGTLSVTEIEFADPAQINDDDANEDVSGQDEMEDVNDDHGNDNDASDDGSNHDANDDHGGSDGGGDNSGGHGGSGG
jgi:hypothetical protein